MTSISGIHRVLKTAVSLGVILGALLTARGEVALAPQPPLPSPTAPAIISGAGDITAVVEQYRNLLGANNGGEPGSRGTGRREINWDGVPDELSAPNFLPP